MYVFGHILYFTDVSNRRVRTVDLESGMIATVAGGGDADIGDGLPATAATFSTHPMRVTVNRSGDMFVTDAHQNRVRRIDAGSGIIHTYAGAGEAAFSGDGGAATAAALNVPHGARFDSRGHLYIADTRNHRIRRVDGSSGLMTTVAGNGLEGFAGDGGPASDAELATPLAVAVDGAANLYVVDTDNSRIRRIDADSGTITTFAGSGDLGPLEDGIAATKARFGRLRDAVITAAGDLLVADGNNGLVFRIDTESGRIIHVAGSGMPGFSGDGGPATDAQLNHPYSIALDHAENLYIKDHRNGRIRRVDSDSGVITTIAGVGGIGFSGDGGAATSARLSIG